MLTTTTKKPSAAEGTDVAHARKLLREAVEAKRAREQYRPMGRLSCAGYCAPLLVGIPHEELDSMRENIRLHGHEGGLYREHALAEGTIFGHIQRQEWPSPPGRKPDLLQFDRLTEREFRIVTVVAARRVEHSSPGVFGALNPGEHEREQRELAERVARTLAAWRAVDKVIRLGFAAEEKILKDPRPDVDLDTRILDYASANPAREEASRS